MTSQKNVQTMHMPLAINEQLCLFAEISYKSVFAKLTQ